MGSVDRRLKQVEPEGDGAQHKQWRSEFPYHWDADELVSRRDLLHFAVYTSGTLFLGTALLALLGLFRRAEQTSRQPIPNAAQLREGEALYFNYPGPQDQAVLLRLQDGRFVAYNQTCTHLSCSVYFQRDKQRLFCPCHEGVFDPATGQPTAGPPIRPLPRIRLQMISGDLFATGVEP